MKFPSVPTVHGASSPMGTKAEWRPPRDADTFRTCFYCGSMENEDFVRVLEAGARVEVADLKYGWPHKIYLDFPNPRAGEIIKIGARSSYDGDKRVEEPIMGERGDFHAKFYTEHLMDEGYDEAALTRMIEAIAAHTRVTFTFKNVDGKRKLWWAMPGEKPG